MYAVTVTAICYTRVSTQGQAESGLGLEAQRAAIEKWCDANGVTELVWFTDEGISGSAGIEEGAMNLASRPGLSDAISAIRRGDVLVVAKRDRLARDYMLAGYIDWSVSRKGGRVMSAAGEGTDNDSAENKLLRVIMDAFAQFERQRIIARTSDAKRKHKANGGFMGGSAPYGYRRDGDKVVPDEHEQGTIRLVRELRGSLSIPKVIKELNKRGIKPRSAAQWFQNQISRITA